MWSIKIRASAGQVRGALLAEVIWSGSPTRNPFGIQGAYDMAMNQAQKMWRRINTNYGERWLYGDPR